MPRPELHRGRLAKHPRVLSVRPLTAEDTLCLREKRVGPPRIQQFRETHHRVARLVAAGHRTETVAKMTGFSANRVAQFRNDPSFQQLVSEYTGKVDEAYVKSMDHYFETATENLMVAETLIAERLERAMDNPEDAVPLNHLIAIASDRADRFGYGKHTTQTNEIKDFAKMMKEMAQRSGRSNVIDAPPLAGGDSPAGSVDPQPESQFGGGFRRIEGRRG